MADYLFLIPALPLLAFAINFIFGRNFIRDKAHWIAAPAVFASFVLSLIVFFNIRDKGEALDQHLFTWIPSGYVPHRSRAACRSADRGHAARGHERRLPRPLLFDRIHAGGSRLLPLLLVPAALRLLDVDAGPGGQLPAAVRLLGSRRTLLVPADRLLLPAPLGQQRRQEGVHRQPHRRPWLRPRHHVDLLSLRHAQLLRRYWRVRISPRPALSAGVR